MKALFTALLLTGSPAFERDGHNVFVFEGIAGVGTHTREYPELNIEPQTGTQAGVLGMIPFSRLGYHRFLRYGVSLGAGAQIASVRESLWFDRDTNIYGLMPRVGWSTPLTGAVSAWLRGGPGIVYMKSEGITTGQLTLGGEAMLMLIPSRDFGVSLAVFYERGFAGREVIEATNTSRRVRYTSLGVSLGVAIAF